MGEVFPSVAVKQSALASAGKKRTALVVAGARSCARLSRGREWG